MDGKVFLSYSHVDQVCADEISSLLSELKVKYFRDTKEIGLGDRINLVVNEGLRTSSAILVIISPASLKSLWVPYEIGQATALGKRVLVYLTHPSIDLPSYLSDFKNARSISEIHDFFANNSCSPLLENKCELVDHPSVSNVTYETLATEIRNAKRRIVIVDAWIAKPDAICFAIKQSTEANRSVSLLLLDPDRAGFLLNQRFKDLGMPHAITRSRHGLKITRGLLGNDDIIRVFNAIPPFNLYWFDDKMYVGHYWQTSLSAYGPFWEINSTQTSMYNSIEQTFMKLWGEAKNVNE